MRLAIRGGRLRGAYDGVACTRRDYDAVRCALPKRSVRFVLMWCCFVPCRAKEVFLLVGGVASAFERAKNEAQQESIQIAMSACMRSELEALGVSSANPPSDEQVKNAKELCNSQAQEAILNVGGDLDDLAFDMQNAVENEVGQIMKSCMAVQPKNLTKCKIRAKAELKNYGFLDEEFDMIFKASKEILVGDIFEACMSAFATDEEIEAGEANCEER